MIVGVAGKYCSGKSTATRCLVDRGFIEINLDAIGHTALEKSTDRIIEQFGTAVLDGTGTIDRKKLGKIIFRDRLQRILLEEILHPKMVEMVKVSLSEHAGKDMVIDGALLFYMGMGGLCDLSIWVSAPFPVRFFRALRRDKLSLPALLQRFNSQRDLTPQPSSNDVDIYYIRNTGSPAALKEKLDRILP